MTTALAAQLQKLAAVTGNNVKRPRGKASLLYSYQEAADIGTESIYAIGLQGFEQLCRLDSRFQPFKQTLFSQANLEYVREQQTAEINAKLNTSILAFCQLLSGYFLLQPSFKALEYLIRRYKINEHNVDALLHAALPYHSTNEFVRLVQVLQLEGGGNKLWEFLVPMQQNGAAMPREVLVQRCVNDKALLRFVCEMAQQLSSPKRAGRVAMSFYAVVLCEVLVAMKTVNEQLVTILLPYLVEGLADDAIPEYRAATHMIIAQLASRVAMSTELVTALVVDICKGAAAASGLPQVLMVLAHLAATQPHFTSFPDRALNRLAKASGVASELSQLAEKGVRLGPLLGLLLHSAATQAIGHPGIEKLLEEIVTHVPLGPSVSPLALSLLAQAGSEGLSDSGREVLLHLLRVLELRYPVELDSAVNAALAAPEEAGSPRDAAGRQRIFALLEAAFGGTVRSPVLEAGTTLALAVDAPSAAVREMALQKLEALSLASSGNEELAAFVQSSVLRRLQDDVPSVALAALRVEALGQTPAGPLFDGLSSCYHKAIQQVLHPGTKKGARKEACEVVKEALKQLSGTFSAKNPPYGNQVALLLLDALPATPLSRRLSTFVLKCAAKMDHPLLQGLHGVKPPSSDGPPTPQPPKKTPKKKAGSKLSAHAAVEPAEGSSDVAFNHGVIAELADQVVADSEAQLAYLSLLKLSLEQQQQQGATGHRTLLVLLAIATTSLRLDGGAAMAGQLLKLLLAHPMAIDPQAEKQPAFTTDGSLTDESLFSLSEGTLSQHAMHAALVLGSLQVVPVEWLVQLGKEGMVELFTSIAQQSQQEQAVSCQLETLVRRAGEVVPVSDLLSDIFAQPPEAAVSPEVEVAALQMWAVMLLESNAGSVTATAKTPKANSKPTTKACSAGTAVQDRPLSALLRLLCTLCHPQRAVRTAGLEAAQALLDSCDSCWTEGSMEGGGKASVSKDQMQGILAAIVACRGVVEADAEAFESLVRRTLSGASGPAGSTAPPTVSKKGRGGAGAKKKAATDAASAGRQFCIELTPADVAALGQLLLSQLPDQHGAAGLHAAAVALRCIAEWAPAAQLLLAGWQLLCSFSSADRQQLTQQETELAADLISLFVPEAVSELLTQDESQAVQVLSALLGALTTAQQGAATVRVAALRALSADLYEVLPEAAKQQAVVALLESVSKDPLEECRAAARAALASIPLASSTLQPLLDISKATALEVGGQPEAMPAAKKKRGTKAAPAETAEAQAPSVDVSKLGLCVAALELLQWKENFQEPLELVSAIQCTLAALLRWQGAGQADVAAPAPSLPAGTYIMQLALSALLGLAKRAQQAREARFDLELAVRCAQAAPDGALRNAALSLVGVLASGAPQDALSFVLEVVGVVGRSAAMQADAHSNKIASQVLAAVVPAWVAGGGSIQEVVAAVVSAAPRIPSHRRLAVFAALVEALPEVEGLCATLSALLEQTLAPAGQQEGADDADLAWGADLAAALLVKSSRPQQTATLAALLQSSMESAAQQPTEPLPMLATAFATQQLQNQATRAGRSAAASNPEVAAGYEALMKAALVQLQRAGEMAAAEGKKEKKGEKKRSASKTLERIKAATECTYKLLQALQRVMAPSAYLSSLAVLVGSQLDKVRRRALALIIAMVKDAGSEESAEQARKEGADASLAEAALAAVKPAVQLLQGGLPSGHEPATALTRQTALAALGTLATAFGSSSPETFLATLVAVLPALQDSRSAVRSSALACIASVTRELGPRLVPALPAVVKGVLSAAHAASSAVASSAGAAQGTAAEGQAEESSGDHREGETKAAVAEAPALELAASLAATSALVESLGAFLAPHLPALLDVLLAPSVLTCRVAGCAELAAGVRARIATGVPPRLLLGPLLAHLEPAIQAGALSVCSLLGMLSSAVSAMDGAATSAHHESIFVFLLRALDLRRRRSVMLAPAQQARQAVDEVESATVAAFVALTLKLSEAQFKPLFLRLLDWASNAPAGNTSAAGAHVARGVALCALVNALTERLRSVFVPYFRYLVDPFVAYLTDGLAATPAKKKKKKQRTSEGGEDTAVAGFGSDPLEVENEWRLRLLVVRALHRCFLYDTVGFLDEARFEQLLPPLVALLSNCPPALASSALVQDASLEDGVTLGEKAAELDVMGRAVVGCLAQLAVTAGSDALWKTLNHQVLMASRSLDPRTRLLSLETVVQLAGRLREEYLVLLPETLPFLAELLEDAESTVESRAAAVLRSLEELSGESLAEYLKA